MLKRGFKTALVLSGGSARGLTHVGVLDELQKENIGVDLIVGTSMGAVIGGLYAYYRDIGTVAEKMRTLFESDIFLKTVSIAKEDLPEVGPDGFFNRFMWLFRRGIYYTHSMIRPTLIPEETYLEIMSGLLPDHPIEDLPIPFAAVTMDLLTGDEIVLTKGSLRKAVAASAAIPGLLPAIELHDRVLVDGGWIDNVPVAPAIALGAHFTIAVDASLDILGLGPIPPSAIENLLRCNEITRITLMRHRKSFADVLIVPEIGQLFWANFACMDKCFTIGREVLRRRIADIKQKEQHRRFRSLNGMLHPARRGNWRHPFIIL